MRRLLTPMTVLLVSVAAWTGVEGTSAGPADDQDRIQTIGHSSSRPASAGPASFFTRDVRVQPLFTHQDSAAYGGAYVTFEPGARSAWHIHPAGQRLIVTEGVGRTQQWGEAVEEIRAGDVVWCPPGVKHWHGAAPESAMTHIALTGVREGENVQWLEHASDEQYGAVVEEEGLGGLTPRQQAMAAIAAFTAGGQLPQLRTALTDGLNAGLTINEIKEILVQMCAYAGFPRSLNGITAFMAVLEEREAQGLTDPTGPEPTPLPTDTSSLRLGTENQTRLLGAPATGDYILRTGHRPVPEGPPVR